MLCTLKGKDESRIRKRFQIPPSIKIGIPSASDRACSYFPDEVCFYEADFANGLRFPIHPFIKELFLCLKIAPTQLVPNSWRTLVCCMVIWMSTNEGDILKVEKFLHFYHLGRPKLPGYWEFKPWDKNSRLVFNSPSSLREWKTKFFFMSSEGWEATPSENPEMPPNCFVGGVLLILVHPSFFCTCICVRTYFTTKNQGLGDILKHH